MSDAAGKLPWVAPLTGFLVGDVFLLVTAITLHNIPEGLAVGVAFGAVAAAIPSATLLLDVALG